MTGASEFWLDCFKDAGVTEEELADWENAHGVTIPSLLRRALLEQNGGLVMRGKDLRINRLDEILPPDAEFWEFADHELEEGCDDYNRSLVFWFGCDEHLGGRFLIDFNESGPRSEPVVLEYTSDPGEACVIADTFEDFINERTTREDAPLFAWSETETLDDVIARQTIDLAADSHLLVRLEQVLGRKEGRLVLYVHELTGEEERYERIFIPEPLDATMSTVQRCRPAPANTWFLHLYPVDADGIESATSVRVSDEDEWDNEEADGVPVYATFESNNRDLLKQIRQQLLG
ncbi:SMI1/KNR4 family protein [Rubinisphaera margarita]|uniref:SMI1/KNR4 family protein n=1 Tax=Rubinisphaera margarita TaxID=2909586 RepID=UPI001EE7EFB9|nr:SMI1/KNR4 family protein [Rubinisphaera margarita]MCG6154727.1 SMI1/KNR4 family protein [Rubinisphaera margarita]